MNTFNINDENYKNSESYQTFLKSNPTEGYLKIRAYAASQALPISNLKIIISKVINNDNIIFFEGLTNESGIIEKISLPTPKLNDNNLGIPSSISYDIKATYQNTIKEYKVNMYENIYVIQTINIVPKSGEL